MLAACDSRPPRQAAAAPATAGNPTPSSPAAPDSVLIPGTPDGDLADWVRDIRNGLAAVPELAATDRAAAQSRTLDLYITRQEYAEMYFGVDGRQRQSAELAVAIETAEDRFHELMQLLATERPSVDEVRLAVAALDEQQAAVGRLWQHSGARLQRSSAR
jgi:hypothetical protein